MEQLSVKSLHVIDSMGLSKIAMPMASVLWREYMRHCFDIYDISMPVRQVDSNIYIDENLPYIMVRAMLPYADECKLSAMPVKRAIDRKEVIRLIALLNEAVAVWSEVPDTWCDSREANIYIEQAKVALRVLFKAKRRYSVVLVESARREMVGVSAHV